MLGLDPRPFTWRELTWMGEGRGMDAWARTGRLWALIANVNCDPSQSAPFTMLDIHPYAHCFPTPGDPRMSVADPVMEVLFRSADDGGRGHD